MRLPFSNPYYLAGNLALYLASTSLPAEVLAISFPKAPNPDLDLSQLGRVALSGNFDSVSVYKYLGQNGDGSQHNGSQSLLARYPNGGFADLESADAYIADMCPFISNGEFQGIVVAGNFTSVGGKRAQAAVLYNPPSGEVTPLPGLTGQVSTVYCDDGVVYFGGSFTGGNSTNAIIWTNGWTNLPFAGFNGPVSSITKLPNGHVVFGGSFTGIGDTTAPKTPNAQVVNIGSANITASPNTTGGANSDPKNIVCRTPDGDGDDWLGQDDIGASWQARFGFGFTPTKLRLLNAQTDGYGVRTFRFTAYPIDGIMNFTYYDDSGSHQCTSECPLQINNGSYQDFYFVNSVGMNEFHLDISDWYENGPGLGGIELLQDDIYSFAVNDFNEPSCGGISQGSDSSATGSWDQKPAGRGQTNSGYLSKYLEQGTAQDSESNDLSVVFRPNIQQSGNYSVTVFTPGCISDNTCDTRGSVNITGTMTSPSSTKPAPPISSELSQTNNYDKYDQVYNGYVQAGTGSFRPSITITPSLGQNGPVNIVAQRVRFELRNATGGLNGLYDYTPGRANIDTDFSNSNINQAGMQLEDEAVVTNVEFVRGFTYVAGNFTSGSFSNIMAIGGEGRPVSLPGQGLDQAVQSIYNADDNLLYMGGNFSNTRNNDVNGLSNVAIYSISDDSWRALGEGVNGPVWSIVPLSVNITPSRQVSGIAFTGYFDRINGFGDNPSIPVRNIAVWIPERENWLQNVGSGSFVLNGQLNAYSDIPDGGGKIFAGTVDSATIQTSDIVGLTSSTSSGEVGLQQLPLTVQASSSSSSSSSSSRKQKRAIPEERYEGVVTGLFYGENGLNYTILGGKYQVRASNGSLVQDLALVNGNNGNRITGLVRNYTADQAILALETHSTFLYAGGSIPDGFLVWDLEENAIASSQPAGLNGGVAVVHAIESKPSSPSVYFGGSFENAGSLGCPALCVYDTNIRQWNVPAQGLARRSNVNAMTWSTSNTLILVGNMTVNDEYTAMAAFDSSNQEFTAFEGAGDKENVPGPITAFSATTDRYDAYFVAGTSDEDGSAFLSKFSAPDGDHLQSGSWELATSPGQLGPSTYIDSVQMLTLSSTHESTELVAEDKTLLVTGLLDIRGFGNASAAIFNGTAFEPLILATMENGSPGRIMKAFVQFPNNLLTSPDSDSLAIGFIVLIALAIALALTFIMILLGIVAEKYRRRREGYVPAPTAYPYFEKNGGKVGNISPQQLFGGVRNGNGNGHSAVPQDSPRI
ncbi:MAG: hypothetical protein M1831_000452 [Alyxoria varia]|nr:MAG: hypothetical protein M1831_000452 [Alyxoria varia]